MEQKLSKTKEELGYGSVAEDLYSTGKALNSIILALWRQGHEGWGEVGGGR